MIYEFLVGENNWLGMKALEEGLEGLSVVGLEAVAGRGVVEIGLGLVGWVGWTCLTSNAQVWQAHLWQCCELVLL